MKRTIQIIETLLNKTMKTGIDHRHSHTHV